MYKLSYFLLFILFILYSCNSKPSEKTLKKIEEIRARLKKVEPLIPKNGDEKLITPRFIADIVTYDSLHKKEVLGYEAIDYKYFISVANGSKDAIELKKKQRFLFSSTSWGKLDPHPFAENKFTVEQHAFYVNKLHGLKYICVSRVKSFTPGKGDKTSITKPAHYQVWFWLIDVQNSHIVGSQLLEASSDGYVVIIDNNVAEAIANNARNNIINKRNNTIRAWAGKLRKEINK
ncbi:hypothetical protein [Microscilla marina]|uniref:Lipoprotein, putative n=1 Tax=Microscilla marina ATCC 23134 TaxID=313606 RepID=A1ZED6_MICM2|nr:hypothetical protein [Microscilla marina]EAY31444.1 lipoprotein, putative [Microscilla marina ATCC 23134]